MTNIKKKEKVEKTEILNSKLPIIELILAIIFGIIAIILIVLAINNDIFVPAATGITALTMFLISYYFKDDEKKKILVYILTALVFILLTFTVIYTLIRTT